MNGLPQRSHPDKALHPMLDTRAIGEERDSAAIDAEQHLR
jgi:hypothetical protein